MRSSRALPLGAGTSRKQQSWAQTDESTLVRRRCADACQVWPEFAKTLFFAPPFAACDLSGLRSRRIDGLSSSGSLAGKWFCSAKCSNNKAGAHGDHATLNPPKQGIRTPSDVPSTSCGATLLCQNKDADDKGDRSPDLSATLSD